MLVSQPLIMPIQYRVSDAYSIRWIGDELTMDL